MYNVANHYNKKRIDFFVFSALCVGRNLSYVNRATRVDDEKENIVVVLQSRDGASTAIDCIEFVCEKFRQRFR